MYILYIYVLHCLLFFKSLNFMHSVSDEHFITNYLEQNVDLVVNDSRCKEVSAVSSAEY